MIPVHTNLKLKSTPWATYALILTNVAIHLTLTYQTGFDLHGFVPAFFSFVPKELIDLNPLSIPKLFTAMFLHGNFLHLAGNMLFLFAFGRNLEDDVGHDGYFALYVTTGVIASLAHAAMNPRSPVPTLGASGAISGIIGAFFVRNPKARISLLLDPALIYLLRRFAIRVPAWIFIPFWFYLQISGAFAPGFHMVAFWAHIGGSIAGGTIMLTIRKSVSKHKRKPAHHENRKKNHPR